MKSVGTPPVTVSILSLETSGDLCSIALLRDGQLVIEHAFRHGMHLSERLMDLVDAVLKEAEITLDAVTYLAVGIGPGSFTGTRISVMTFKTIASVRRIPLYGVNGLEALAFEYRGIEEVCVFPLLPCRSQIVFAAGFRNHRNQLEPILSPSALTLSDLCEQIQSTACRNVLLCGSGCGRYRAEIEQAMADAPMPLSFGVAQYPRASVVAEIAYRRHLAGDPGDDALALVPLYISPPPITLPRHMIAPPSASE